MKKIISGLMLLFLALTLTSCVELNSETELEFTQLPQAVINDDDAKGKLSKSEILVKIGDNEYTLEAAEKVGAVVEGAEYEGAGYHTLLVTYKDVTIAFTYLVNVEPTKAYDISWYDAGEPYVISNAAELRGLAYLVNEKNICFAGKTVSLDADIDLAGYAWTPIGEGSRENGDINTIRTDYTFQGHFDGQNHVVKNLTDAGYLPSKVYPYVNSANQIVYGYVYGLFGMINASGVVIENVKLENVEINGAVVLNDKIYYADSAAGIVGYSCEAEYQDETTITISNCVVSGDINGYDAMAGIAGRLSTGKWIIKNCVNKANVTTSRASGDKTGGIVGGNTGSKSYLELESCVNSGVLKGAQNVGGYVGFFGASSKTLIIDGTKYTTRGSVNK